MKPLKQSVAALAFVALLAGCGDEIYPVAYERAKRECDLHGGLVKVEVGVLRLDGGQSFDARCNSGVYVRGYAK